MLYSIERKRSAYTSSEVEECACMHVCAPHAHSAQGRQKRASAPLELEFQVAVSCPTPVRN